MTANPPDSAPVTAPIFHIAEPERWERALATGSYVGSTRGLDLDRVGFIHCSFEHQVAGAANAFYGDWTEALLLLEIDPERAGAELRVENLDGGAELFPHLYGPLPVAAVVAVEALERGRSGWALPGAP
ncbi:MAG: DUF952 domain-containing protein [Marmoricola sp.]